VKNFYHVLGLSFDPPPEQQLVEAAYRALVKLYHPDVYKGDRKSLKRKISEINQAYDVLSDDKKRKDYDKNLKKIQIDKSFQFDDDELEDKDLFNSKYIDEDWEIALLVYPELENIKEKLLKYSLKLSFQFQFYLLETKEFNKLDYVESRFIDAFLERKFGTSFEIKSLSKFLIENKYKKNAKYLNKLIQVLGTRSEKRIIKTFFEQFPEIENIFSKQSKVKEKKDHTGFFENYQNYLLVILVIFLITFIFIIVSV
jgi:curved DNA-binding protein CbpA